MYAASRKQTVFCREVGMEEYAAYYSGHTEVDRNFASDTPAFGACSYACRVVGTDTVLWRT